MWTKTIEVIYQKTKCQVQVWFNDELEDKCVVAIQSMYCEWFLYEEVLFECRDAAYEFIKHYSKALGKDFVIRQAIDVIHNP